MEKNVFVYRIDRSDVITGISSNWAAFATENDWAGTCGPEQVVGVSIFDFIDGLETRHLYMALFKKVRSGCETEPIPFRCDSPRKRRFLELMLRPLPGGHIELHSTIVRREDRPPVPLLDRRVPRSEQLLRVCSMCKKIDVSRNSWVEMDAAVAQLRLFEAEKVPRLTHGMCPACFQTAMGAVSVKH